MEIKNSQLERTAVMPEQYPDKDLPEIAFVGRSNIGKSSIINCLLNKKNLAHVGATPGKTRVINFYNIDNQIFFVDLPGYGYAKVSKVEKESWNKMIEAYLFTRTNLKLIVMLVDIRHAPSEDDKLMYEWILSRSISSIVVATKIDKISRSQLSHQLLVIKSTLNMQDDAKLIPVSTMTGQGIAELWNRMMPVVY
jgi:GTP-binding protein